MNMRNSRRQAITTRYLGTTSSRGSRIRASAEAGSVTVPYDHALSASDNHAAAAEQLRAQWQWGGSWVGGVTAKGDYVWVETST